MGNKSILHSLCKALKYLFPNAATYVKIITEPRSCVAIFPLLDGFARPGAIPRKGGYFPMRDYELIFIVHPDLDENAFRDLVTKVQGWVTDGGGQVEKVDLWGKRRLAYPIRKQKEGQYVFMTTKLDPTAGSKLERNLGLTEPILRYSLIAA
jgi:small subunit ribosomal protein S6